MCGIVYVQRHDGKPAAKAVSKRYRAQKTRGSDGFGYIAIKDNKIVSFERSETEHDIMQKMMRETAPEILFHHRYPTSGPNVEEMAHPIPVEYGNVGDGYFIVHNGVINNPCQRKEVHENLGFRYKTELKEALRSTLTGKVYDRDFSKFNDSESLAIDTVLALEEGRSILSTGSAAVVGVKVKDGVVAERFFYRNDYNPLFLHKNKVMTTLTSQAHDRSKPVPTVHIMRFDGKGEMEKHPRSIWVPTTYDAYGTGGGNLHGTTHAPRPPYRTYDDEDVYAREAFEQEAVLQSLLPKGERTVELLGKTSEPAAIITFEDDKEEEFDSATLKKAVNSMSDKILWEEYRLVTDALIQLEGDVEKLDGLVNADNVAEVGYAIRQRKTLQGRLDRNKIYQKIIEDQIEERDAFSQKLERLV